jgi:hypothetical protein
VTDKKVVGITSAKKPCQYCGADPAHPDLSCPRIKYAEIYEDGSLAAVEFFEPEIWKPRA